jgi:hypothetical protein
MACNGSLGNAPHALAAWLLAADYSAHCRERIVSYASAEGTLTGCPELDREDEATATEVWVEALPAVPQTGREWCDPMEWTLPEAELEAIDAELFAAECDRRDAVDAPGDRPWITLMMSESSGLPPISGGAPEPFTPSAEDWADYHGWSEDLERRRRQVSDDELGQIAAHGCV